MTMVAPQTSKVDDCGVRATGASTQSFVQDAEQYTLFLPKVESRPGGTWIICMVNKIIEEEQMTITWHVDDRKILHKNAWEMTKIIKCL